LPKFQKQAAWGQTRGPVYMRVNVYIVSGGAINYSLTSFCCVSVEGGM